MNSHIQRTNLDLIPESPGVYLMKDASGSVIYVGKAINLRNRLRSYFAVNPKGNSKVLAMISHINDFDYLLCNNETESLILECNLIKQHKPHYNILLRDDKEYPYIRITFNEEYPRVMKSFRVGDDIKTGVRYYGPYMNNHLRSALKTLRAIFPIKSCNLVLPRDMNKNRPCLNYYIGKCIAPCQGNVPREDYRKVIDDIGNFLKGRYDGIVKMIRQDMEDAAERHDFEKAAIYRDRLNSLLQLMEKQTVADITMDNIDVIGYASNQTECCVQKMEIRQGRLIGSAAFFAFEEASREEILVELLLQHYTALNNIPPRIYLPFHLEEGEIFEEALSMIAERSVKSKVPARGYGREMMELAMKNASQSLRRHSLTSGKLAEMGPDASRILSKVLLGETDKIRRIEAFDISNYGDDDISASMVVFINGKAEKSQYRLFKIKELEIRDDYRAMKQAIRRRLIRLRENTGGFTEVPSLILVDGGLQHVRAVQKVLQEAQVPEIALAGMVKNRKHQTSGLVKPDGTVIPLTVESKEKVLTEEERRALLRLITAVQDEAHRFALTYTRKLSFKRNTRFLLETIPGVGPVKRKILLAAFGSLRLIAQASLEELQKTKGINEKTASEVYKHFHA